MSKKTIKTNQKWKTGDLRDKKTAASSPSFIWKPAQCAISLEKFASCRSGLSLEAATYLKKQFHICKHMILGYDTLWNISLVKCKISLSSYRM